MSAALPLWFENLSFSLVAGTLAHGAAVPAFCLNRSCVWDNGKLMRKNLFFAPPGGSRDSDNPTQPMKTYSKRVFSRNLIVSTVILAPMICSSAANAGGVALQLVRTSLINVNDAAGRWQHEGGNVRKGAVTIGQYLIVRRVTLPAVTPLNTASTTITLFLGTSPATSAQNITLQGAHSFTAGNFKGSVSSASNKYTWIQGADATYSAGAVGTSNLVMLWNGASQLTVP